MDKTWGMDFVNGISVFEKIHQYYRSASNYAFYKGEELDTEYYSIFGPVVETGYDGLPMARMPGITVQELSKFDVIIVAGEALSHCVGESLHDMIDARLGKKIYLLEDCTSNVTGCQEQGQKYLDLLQAHDGHVVKSTTPFLDWPGVYKLYKDAYF
jgi:nicotinamidase-related amidase